MGFQRTIATELDAAPERVFDQLASLDSYPTWLSLIHEVEPADAHGDEPGPAWMVTLRAKVGPFARSKRLRMVRTVHDRPGQLRFERAETDGRDHSPWIVDVAIAADPNDGSTVTVDLRYEGNLWTAPLEPVLGHQVDTAVPNLKAIIEAVDHDR